MTSRVSPRGTAAHRSKPSGRAVALIAPELLVVGLSLWNNARKSAWTDEAFSFATAARHPLTETVSRALHFELQPPLYFSLLNLWLRADPTIEFGRLLSTIFALGAVAVLWATGRRLEMRHPSLVAWIAALTTGLMWASTELRGYALVLLLVATSNLLFVTLVLTDGRDSRRTAATYAGAAIACLLTFYYTGFVLAGQWLAAMVAGRRRALVTGALVAAAIVMAPLAPTILMQIAAHPNPHLAVPGRPHFDLYGAISTLLEGVLGETPLFQVPHIRPIALAALGAAPVAWLVSRRARGLARRRTAGLGERPSVSPAIVLAIVVIVPLLILGTLRATGAVLVYPRHTLVALPGLLLWLGYLIDSVPRRSGQFAVGTAVVALLLVALVDYEIDGVQIADWRGAAHYVAARAAPSEPVFVAPAYEALPFQYYYRPTAVLAVPAPMPLTVMNDAGNMLRDSAQLAVLFDSAAGSRPFWMVISDRPTVGNYGRPVLEHYLQQRYRVLSDTATFNVSVRHLVQR